MYGVANGAEMLPCPHCGKELRRGMIRCRECGESVTEVDGDFVLTGHKLVASQERKCARCGCVLEPGVTDCPSCASAMLDELLMAPSSNPEVEVPGPKYGESRMTPLPEPPVRPTAPVAAKPARNVEAPVKPQPQRTKRKSNPDLAAVAPESKAAREVDDSPDEAGGSSSVETSAACAALLASLATADTTLRCEIATALGKLGDKAALGPLERFMVDPDIRVRRAVAAALILLGHPKGATLTSIAERAPAATITASPPVKPAKKKSSGGGGASLDPAMLKKVGGGLAAALLLGGGIWWWMSQPSGPVTRRRPVAKAPAAKKPAASAAKSPNRGVSVD